MAKKGITPIIAIIVLLLITVSLAGLSYTFLSSILVGQIEKSFFVSPGSAYCENVQESWRITIFMKNTGTTSSLGPSDFLVKTIGNDTTQLNISDADFPTISPQTVGRIQTNCGSSCPAGRNRIRFSTGATTSPPILVSCS